MRCLTAVAFTALTFTTQVAEGTINFRGSSLVKKEDITQTLEKDLVDQDHRLPEYEDGLRDLFAALPKNPYGNLDHPTVRYALHRFFVARHGWFIRGLEPTPYVRPDSPVKGSYYDEWVPNFLQEIFEGKLTQGADLRGLAVLALSLEDLARKETDGRLQTAYEAQHLATDKPLPQIATGLALHTFMMSFLLSNNWTVDSDQDLMFKETIFRRRYSGYKQVKEWTDKLFEPFIGVDEGTPIPFENASAAAHELGKHFVEFNKDECDTLRSTLKSMEGKKPGRVRLSQFYNMSLYTHWRFTEKAEYLRSLGALDESDSVPMLISANYAIARPNCLDATNVFAICCPNVCEDYTSSIEKAVGAPHASPAQIAELVAKHLTAPLSATLLSRLDEVSATNGGRVPLHGRLFSQWMHHTFPNDCPSPRQDHLNPQTADEWLSGTGDYASEQEIRDLVAADTCAWKEDGTPSCEQSAELPWSSDEQLLTIDHPVPKKAKMEEPEAEASKNSARLPIFLVGIMVALALAAYSKDRSCPLDTKQKQRLQVVAGALIVSSTAMEFGLLDVKMFLVAVVAGLGITGASVAQKYPAKAPSDWSADGLPMSQKSV